MLCGSSEGFHHPADRRMLPVRHLDPTLRLLCCHLMKPRSGRAEFETVLPPRAKRKDRANLSSYFAAKSSNRFFVNRSAVSARLRHRSACCLRNSLSILSPPRRNSSLCPRSVLNFENAEKCSCASSPTIETRGPATREKSRQVALAGAT
jgi:hypothetical protein